MQHSITIAGRLPAILLPLVLAAGCGLVHKVDVQQGNILRAKDIELLETGLSKSQVNSLIGTPAIADPFNQQRWDYVASYSPRGESLSVRHLRLTFDENDRLVNIEGDYLDTLQVANAEADAIASGEEEAPIRTDENAVPQPNLPAPPSSNDGNQN